MTRAISLADLEKMEEFKKEAVELLSKQAKRLVEKDEVQQHLKLIDDELKEMQEEVTKLREKGSYGIFDDAVLDKLVDDVATAIKNEQKTKMRKAPEPQKDRKVASKQQKWNLLKEFAANTGGHKKVKLTEFKSFLSQRGFTADAKQWLKPLGLPENAIERISASPGDGSWFHLSRVKFPK